MSNTDPAPEAINLTPGVVPAVDVVEARKAAIGDGAEVRRLLPQRTLRTIGAWCFLDHYGPDEVSRGHGMRVPPHPHIGPAASTATPPGCASACCPRALSNRGACASGSGPGEPEAAGTATSMAASTPPPARAIARDRRPRRRDFWATAS